jgi:hypothetical protein
MATFEEATKFAIGLTQQQLVAKAKQLNKEIMDAAPHPLAMVRHVDGVRDAPEETVKPDGVIVYDYDRLDQVVEFALETLRQLSPVDSGDYARGHVVMLNGEVVDGLGSWKPGDRITISNPEPYARKIEIGKNGYRANGHVYDKAERLVNRRFGNMATAFLIYDTAPPGAIHEWAGSASGAAWAKSQRGGNSAKHTEWLTRQPTLLIEENG